MTRHADHVIDDLFLRRWSPRAMSGEPMSMEALMRLFEASRWAPSSGNSQPWRFVYARAGTPEFHRYFDLLADGNKRWCHRAGALVIVVAKTQGDDGRPWRTHAFDTGAAWMALALQGTLAGFVVHGMGGFDRDRAREVAHVPEGHDVMCMIAVGHSGKIEDLDEPERSRETANDRQPVSSFVHEGRFEEG